MRGRPSSRPRLFIRVGSWTRRRARARLGTRTRLDARQHGRAEGLPVAPLLGDRQLVVRLVVDEAEAATAQDVAKRQVSPLHLDACSVDAARGNVRKPALPRLTRLDVLQLGAEPPQAVTDLTNVVHAAFTSRPHTRQLSDIRGIFGRARDRGEVGSGRTDASRRRRGVRRGVVPRRRAGRIVPATRDRHHHDCDEHGGRRPTKSGHARVLMLAAFEAASRSRRARQPPQNTLPLQAAEHGGPSQNRVGRWIGRSRRTRLNR